MGGLPWVNGIQRHNPIGVVPIRRTDSQGSRCATTLG